MVKTPPLLSRAHELADAFGAWASIAIRESVIDEGALPEQAGPARRADGPAALRDLLERLGVVFIKLGQVLSTRPDLLPQPYMDALQGLQSRVAPMPAPDVEAVLTEYRQALGTWPFASFDTAPIAAASLAEVHRARLLDGTDVAVKLLRRGVGRQVALDLRLLGYLARFAQSWIVSSDVYDLPGIVEELGLALSDEIDLRTEAESLTVFARNLAEWSPDIRVPDVYESLSTSSVLVMELVRGRSLGDGGAADLEPARRATLSRSLAMAYFKMFFVDGFFHADPHPGNIFVTDEGTITLLDFGMVGRIERQLSDNLVRVLLNFHLKESHGVAHAFLDIGKPSASADEIGWIMDVRRLVPRYHGKRLDRLNVGTLLIDLLRCAARNGIQAPAIVALVCKSLANMDGSARLVDPNVDVIGVFREFLPRLLEAHAERVASVEDAAKLLLDVYVGAQRIPFQVATILEKAATGRLRVVVDPLGGGELAKQVGRAGSRVAVGHALGAWLIARALRDTGSRRSRGSA